MEVMTAKVEEDIVEYQGKYEELNSTHARVLERANELNDQARKQTVPTRQREPTETPEYTRFQSHPEMKPTILNQDSDIVDINEFCNQFRNYMTMGYKGKPPNAGISMHLSTLMHPS